MSAGDGEGCERMVLGVRVERRGLRVVSGGPEAEE